MGEVLLLPNVCECGDMDALFGVVLSVGPEAKVLGGKKDCGKVAKQFADQ